MFTKIRKSGVMIIAAMLVILAWCPRPAVAEQTGSGIWVYNTDMSIALINLTNYPLTFVRTGAYPDESGGCASTGQQVLDWYYGWQVEPYRTKTWGSTNGCDIAPRHYEGTLTLTTVGFPNTPGFPGCKAFDLVFKKQHANNLAELGTWVSLSPSYTVEGPDTGWKDWWAVNNWGYQRWATSYNDFAMHNVMTLIGSACMVALYSSDNKNLVVVVQQYYQEGATPGTVLWDDTWRYVSYALDFVDNAGSSVPGQ